MHRVVFVLKDSGWYQNDQKGELIHAHTLEANGLKGAESNEWLQIMKSFDAKASLFGTVNEEEEC